MRSISRFFYLTALTILIACFTAVSTPAAEGGFNPIEMLREAGVEATADNFEFVGSNMIAKGNVMARYQDMVIYADEAKINNESKDVELNGNVRFFRFVKENRRIEYWELSNLEADPSVRVDVTGTIMSVSGRQLVEADITREEAVWSGERASGNFQSGVFEFGKYASRFGMWQCMGESAVRRGDGKIEIKDATLSTCDTLFEGHEMWSIKSAKVVGMPPPSKGGEDFKYQDGKADDLNEYRFWAYNNVLYIGSVPVLWLPVVYKPPRGEEGKWTISGGYDTAYGGFVKTTNAWRLSDDPTISTTNLLDFYSKRGVGFGNETELLFDNSKTTGFFYGINDWDPNYSVADNSRWNIDPFRYDISLSHMTHVTPKLDIRGHFEKLSDIDFLDDFFAARADTDPWPATFANAEYQTDWFVASILVKPRVNTFFNEVQKLPELKLDGPRQELLWNLYHQGEMSVDNMQMSWRDFDKDRTTGNRVDPKDYHAWRFDTLQFLYYPINTDWVNILPRAGLRLTGYDRSSERHVSSNDLMNMINVNQIDSTSNADIYNYDGNGGGKFRVLGELGTEVNTKITNKWDDIKNAYFDLDGIRHVFVPYMNYTYLTPPSVNRKNLFYFDDTDRIIRQNFVRLGMENRLQTRRGNWKNPQVYTWASMENYLDLNVQPQDGNSMPQDFGTIFKFKPHEELTFTTDVLMNSGEMSVNRVTSNAEWEFIKGWSVYGRYFYGGGTTNEGTYSMGSTLTQVDAGSSFMRSFPASNNVTPGLNFTINERTKGNIEGTMDMQNHIFRGGNIQIIRELPCHLQLILGYGVRSRGNTDGDGTQMEQNFSLSLGFSKDPGYAINPREGLLPPELQRSSNN